MGLKTKKLLNVLNVISRDTESARPFYLSQNYSLEKPSESELISDPGLDPLFLKFDSEKAPFVDADEVRDTARKFI